MAKVDWATISVTSVISLIIGMLLSAFGSYLNLYIFPKWIERRTEAPKLRTPRTTKQKTLGVLKWAFWLFYSLNLVVSLYHDFHATGPVTRSVVAKIAVDITLISFGLTCATFAATINLLKRIIGLFEKHYTDALRRSGE